VTIATPLPPAASVAAAAVAIAPHVRRTPVLRADVDGRPLVLKLEHLQRGGSFKLRGAVNALASGPSPREVVTASGGNHGIAVATAAALLGLPATVYVPVGAPEGKTRRIEAAGARLVRHGATYGEAAAAAVAAAQHPDVRYLAAYDDPAVVAGQGTVTAEVVADAPEVDAVVVAAGGGGLAAGAALAAGGRTVAVVEPENCCCVHRALAAGRPVDSPVDSVAASALGATRVGEVPFGVLRSAGAAGRLPAGLRPSVADAPSGARPTPGVVSVLVTDAELLDAQTRLWEEFRLAVEPAAAVPFAAWLAGRVPGDRACLVVCGANT
jgi:threonine dehydratase